MSNNNITCYLSEGLASGLPASPVGVPSTSALCLYYATDTNVVYAWTGSAWVKANPTATGSVLGLVKPDGTTIIISAGVLSVAQANPSNKVGLAAVNGSSTSSMRADAAPALDQSIAPTWTGAHIFAANVTLEAADILQPTSVTISSTTHTLAATSSHYALTLQSNVTLTLSAGTEGQKMLLQLIQDATGSRTVAFDSSVQFGSDITSFTASTAANDVDYVLLVYNSTLSKWCFLSYVRGF